MTQFKTLTIEGSGMVPNGEYVRKEDYAALQQKLDAVLAENVALKSAFNPEVIPEEAVEAFTETAIMDHDWDDTGAWSWVENDTDVIRAVMESLKPGTPATDAILNEVRAEAQREFCQNFERYGKVEPYHFNPYFADLYAKISKRIYDGILDNPDVHDMSSLVDWLEQGAADSRAYADMAIEHAAQLRDGIAEGGV